MTTHEDTVSVVKPPAIPLSSQQLANQQANRLAEYGTHYQSRGLVAQQTESKLIGAAATLLSLLSRINHGTAPDDIPRFHNELLHEMKAFEFECQTKRYHQDTLLAARYIFCVTLDEAIEKTHWQAQWEPFRLLTSLQLEDWCGDGFFQLLENLSKFPEQHIELLELMYYCLSLGFEGKYRQMLGGSNTLLTIRDQLYQTIRAVHHDFKPALCSLKPAAPLQTHLETSPLPSHRWWKLPAFTAVSLGIAYLGFSYLLNLIADPTLQHSLHIVH